MIVNEGFWQFVNGFSLVRKKLRHHFNHEKKKEDGEKNNNNLDELLDNIDAMDNKNDVKNNH